MSVLRSVLQLLAPHKIKDTKCMYMLEVEEGPLREKWASEEPRGGRRSRPLSNLELGGREAAGLETSRLF